MASFKKNDDAVSAVIGVILMVAITVILAAVIAAFVFQLGGNVPKSKSVGVEVKRTTTDGVIQVKTMSGSDVGLLKSGMNTATPPAPDSTQATYTVTVDGKTLTGVLSTGATPATADKAYTANSIGAVMFFGGSDTSNTADKVKTNADVTVIAHFTDGTDFPAWSGNLA